MNKAMFAIVAEGGGPNPTDEYVNNVKHFFGASVDEGMRMLKKAKEEAEESTTADAGEVKEEEEEEDDEEDDGFDDN